MRKGENAGYQHFLLYPQCFQKASNLGLLTLPKQQILDSFKLKGLADDNFKFDENGRMFSTTV